MPKGAGFSYEAATGYNLYRQVYGVNAAVFLFDDAHGGSWK